MNHIHLIGIGGISMSAIAELLLHQGVKISGSDIENTSIIEKLKSHGAEVFIGHSASNIKKPDLVVYTAAVHEDNPERMEASRLNIPQIDRAEILGNIMSKYDTPIAISGSHGKTTTTSMLSIFLENSGFDPTILVGGELDEIGGNVKIGKSQYFITEACEYVESFLKFKPFVGVILNIDVDHLDYFQDLKHIKNSFKKFASLIPNNGFLIACGDDSNTMDVTGDLACNLVTFGIDNNCDYKAENVTFNKLGYPSFEVFHSGAKLGNFELNVRGQHNIYNTLASIATAHVLGMSSSQLVDSAKMYKGIHRRFEFKGKVQGVEVYDDYAHHPAEIKATLSAAKKFVKGDIWCIFQPHTYTRTRSLLEDFSTSFDLADHLIMADIYAAREIDDGTIHSKNIVELTKIRTDSLYIQDFDEIVEYIYNNIKPNDIVITMGAGDIFKVADLLISRYS
ncbi:MAG: UDP-N-acetylmuramate--L-alanine ligase [Alkaliphilus sp.]|nr:UDP-N-acetylmuramate--L-alanine ligase [Alkaliphilus transvaalensis]PHS32957.1 MAG: UDP-N-acetylmuramate--L-alanine ligase [Alkaliphilus sp.]